MSTKLARGATCTPTIKGKATFRRLLITPSEVPVCVCPAETPTRGLGLVTRGGSAAARMALAITKNVTDRIKIVLISNSLDGEFASIQTEFMLRTLPHQGESRRLTLAPWKPARRPFQS